MQPIAKLLFSIGGGTVGVVSFGGTPGFRLIVISPSNRKVTIWLPSGLTDFVDPLIPELPRRGLFRTAYEGRTLRENLGLPFPETRWAAARRPAHAAE